MNKTALLIILAVLFVIVNLFIIQSNMTLKRSLVAKNVESAEKIKLERENIRDEVRQDLDEKYRADIVSYKAMVKRLEFERKKMKKLEEELEELKKN